MRRPRTWEDLRRRVLEEGYLEVAELEHRKRRAQQTKYGIWLVPLALLGLVMSGTSLVAVIAIALIVYAGIAAYFIGRTWEQRWDELIQARSAGERPG